MQDRADTVLAKGQNPMGALAVDASHVYFTDYGSDGGGIRRVPREGGAVERVLYCGSSCFPQAVRLDTQNVYFRVGYNGTSSINGHVQVMSKADFKGRVLSSDNGNGVYFYGMEVEVNASVAYWNWTGGTSPYGIFRSQYGRHGLPRGRHQQRRQLARSSRRRRRRVLLALWRGNPALEVRARRMVVLVGWPDELRCDTLGCGPSG